MGTSAFALELFAAGTCGATVVRNLLRTLALKDFGVAIDTLDRGLDHPLIKFGFRDAQPVLLEDARNWLSGADSRFEYQYVRLALHALQRLGIDPDVSLSALAMRHAYLAGDVGFAKEAATRLLREAGRKTPTTVVVNGHDILGRIHLDEGDFEAGAKVFAAGAKAARAAQLGYEEWDHRTNRVACLQALGNHLEALREIEAAESIARRINRPDALTKTLIDRGNSEMQLGRLERAREAFEGALAAAEAADSPSRQSDALGNLGSIAYLQSDYPTAESYHRRALAISNTLSDPASAQYDLNNLAQVLWKQGRSEEAAESLEAALRLARRRGDEGSVKRYGDGLRRMYEALGKYRAAEMVGRSQTPPAVKQAPERPAVGAQGDEAEDEAEEAKRKQAAELEKRVRALMNEQRGAEARRLLEAHLNNEPTDWRARSLYGVILSAAGDEAGARAQYERALAASPAALEPHYRIVDSHAKTGELEDLLARYERLVADEPFRAGVRLGLALLYAGLQRLDDSIQQALEAVRLAPDEDLPYKALAEGQIVKAHSLLPSNWDGAWLVFQDCSTTLFRLTGSGSEQKGQWLAFAGKVFEQFATASHFTNPPFDASMDSREIDILATATNFYRQAHEHDPWRGCDRDIDRVYEMIRALAKPRQMAIAAGHLRLDGWTQEALTLLILSLQVDPEHADSYHQLALLMYEWHGEEGRKAALDYIGRAIRLDPQNQSYREAERFFNLRLPIQEEAGGGGGHNEQR